MCRQPTPDWARHLSEVYVAQEFPPANKQATLQMVKDIEAAMDQDIDTLDWMSPATKVRAKEKLRAVADKIGYPDHWRDYSALSIARDDAFGNALRATEFENRRQLAKIGKPVDRGEWLITPATVDAYYNPSMNDINFPAGILQSPLYDSQRLGCLELRPHWRRRRPRTYPWIRRPGTPIRCQRKSRRLVDAGGRKKV